MTGRAPAGVRRAAALAILLVLSAAVGAGLVTPVVITHRAYDDSIRQLRFQLERHNRVAATAEHLRARLDRLAERRPGEENFLNGETEALAGAELLNRVKSIVQRAGGTVESTQPLPAAKEGILSRIAVRARLIMTVPALQRILHAVESGKPALFVDAMEVTAGKSKGHDTSRPVPLSVSIDLFGYERGGTL